MQLADKKQIEKSIVEQIFELEQQLKLTEQSSQTVELDQTLAGRVSRIDAIQQQKMAQSSHQRDKKRLAELTVVLVAIRELTNDEFGLCEECDEEIPIARLIIKPESKYCITCQELRE